MDTSAIEFAIYESDISLGAALEGDCGPIARAIQNVFGGEYVVVSDDDARPRHAAVRINGQLFDGTGKTRVETLLSQFTPRHAPDIESGQSVEDCTHLAVVPQLTNFVNNPSVTEDVESRLREALEEL